MDEVQDGRRVLYTVGHSNHTLDVFLDLLTQRQIDVLVDTRSRPHSSYVPHFNHDILRPAVVQAGLRFVYLGQELGGRPEGMQYYDAEGHVLYDRVAQRKDFQAAIAKLERGAVEHKIALLCSEENPAHCHRRLLVGRVLGERGAWIVHVRGDGRLQTETELIDAEKPPDKSGGQQSLFDLDAGGQDDTQAGGGAWRSTQSVSRKGRPGNSSRR